MPFATPATRFPLLTRALQDSLWDELQLDSIIDKMLDGFTLSAEDTAFLEGVAAELENMLPELDDLERQFAELRLVYAALVSPDSSSVAVLIIRILGIRGPPCLPRAHQQCHESS